jgi:polyisoprenoid-binding protein YceI
MNKIKMALAALIIMASGSFAQTNWKIDPSHSHIQFSVSHLVISEVSGYFKQFEGSVSAKDDNFTNAKISFTAEVKSISTDDEKRDEHLRTDDFFNAAKYPQIKFVGKSFKKISGNKYKLTGDFTMRDVTKTVTLDVVYNGNVKDPWGNTRAGFKITGSVNRFDYNLKWNGLLEAGGATVGKTVAIICNVEVIKSK